MKNASAYRLRLLATAALAVLAQPVWAAEEHAKGLPQLDPSSYSAQIFWLFVHFIVLYALMSKLVLPRLSAIVEGRAAGVASDLNEAEKLQKQVLAAKGDYEAALTKARAEAHATREASLKAAKSEMLAAEQKLAGELADRAKVANERIATATAELSTHLREVASEVTAEIVARLSGQSVDRAGVEAAVSRVADGTLKEVA